MVSLSRRTVLRLGGATLAGGLAGCSARDQQSSETLRLGELVATNYDPRPHTVRVIFLDDGDPVYWESKEATPAEDGVLGGARFEEFPTEPRDHVLHVRADDQPESEWERFDFGEYDVSCLGIKIGIGDINQTDVGDVSIWKTTSSSVCEGENATSR